jgi:receptor protein-tyrosine kinase
MKGAENKMETPNQSSQNSGGAFTIDLIGAALYLLDHVRVIALVTAAFIVMGGGYSLYKYNKLASRGYQSNIRLAVESPKQTLLNQLQRVNPQDQLVQECLDIANSAGVKAEAAQAAELSFSPAAADLNRALAASRIGSLRIISLTAQASTAEDAVKLADAYARVASERANAIREEKPVSVATIASAAVRIVDVKDANGIPAGLKSVRNTILFFAALGFCLAFVAMLGLFFLDQRLKSPAEVVRETGLSVISILPVEEDSESYADIFEKSADALTERLISAADGGAKTIMITSCRRSAGKTFVATRLLRSIAQTGRRAVLLDADLSGSTLAEQYGLDLSGADVNAYLSGGGNISDAIINIETDGAFVAPVAMRASRAMPALCGERFASLVEYMRKSYELVLVDATEIDPSGEALAIAKLCDAALIIAAPRRIKRTELRAAVEAIAAAGCKPLGAVFNQVSFAGWSDRIYYLNNYYDWLCERFGRKRARSVGATKKRGNAKLYQMKNDI